MATYLDKSDEELKALVRKRDELKKEIEDIKKDWLEDFLKKIEKKDPCPYEPKPWIVPQLPGEPLIYKVTCSE